LLVKYSSTGAHLWSRLIGGTSTDVGGGVAVDVSGNIVVTGLLGSWNVDMGGGPLSLRGAFLAKYTPAGGHLWSRTFGGGQGTAVAVDQSGGIMITGNFRDTIDLGGGPFTSVTNSTWGTPSDDAFIARYSAAGGHLWSRAFGGGTDTDSGTAVGVDPWGNWFVAGVAIGGIDLGGGPLGGNEVFVVKYASSGQHLWSQRFRSSGLRAHGLAVDPSGSALIAGEFGWADFGSGIVVTAGSHDVFLLKLAP
jgi:hypothetical protein